jgi:hypothetical protein
MVDDVAMYAHGFFRHHAAMRRGVSYPYPGLAVQFDARQGLASIPSGGIDPEGIIVSMPTNF